MSGGPRAIVQNLMFASPAAPLPMDERDAIRIGREIVAQLNWRKLGWSKRVPIEEPR